MEDITPYLEKHFFEVTESMFSYRTGKKVRKNRKFIKSLWLLLHTTKDPTIDDVIAHMRGTRKDGTIKMIRSNIHRGGWKWLEGSEGDIFGEVFVAEYIHRWELLENNDHNIM